MRRLSQNPRPFHAPRPSVEGWRGRLQRWFVRQRAHLAGFSLPELAVSVAIICCLATLLLAAVSSTRATAKRIGCIANLRQIGAGCISYSADHNFTPVPPSLWYVLSTQGYIPQSSAVWICPADDRTNKVSAGVGPISYAYNGQKLGLAPTYWNTASLGSLATLTNPASLVYFSDATNYWMNKTKANQNATFRHQGKINALFFDGHVDSQTFGDPSKFYDQL